MYIVLRLTFSANLYMDFGEQAGDWAGFVILHRRSFVEALRLSASVERKSKKVIFLVYR